MTEQLSDAEWIKCHHEGCERAPLVVQYDSYGRPLHSCLYHHGTEVFRNHKREAMPEQPKPGEQPLPPASAAENVCVQDAVREHWTEFGQSCYADMIAYLEGRKQLGVRRYGQALHVANGRDAGVDAFEEAFDLVMYVAQMILERDCELPAYGEYYPEDGGETDTLFSLFDMAQQCLFTLGWVVREANGSLPPVYES